MEESENEYNKQRLDTAKAAGVDRLLKFSDLSIIGTFAEKFSQDPDWVYENTSFDTIMNFIYMWKEQADYQERYLAKLKNPNNVTPSNV